MACGQVGLPFGVHLPVGTVEVSVATNDFFGFRIPDNELLVGILSQVKLVNVAVFSSAATCRAEGNLAQSANLPHHVRALIAQYHVYFVLTLVGSAEQTLGSQFRVEQSFTDGLDNLLFHMMKNTLIVTGYIILFLGS